MSLWFVCYYSNHIPLLNKEQNISFTSLENIYFYYFKWQVCEHICRYADVNVQRPEVSYPFGSCEVFSVGVETWTQPPVREECAPNHWVVFPALMVPLEIKLSVPVSWSQRTCEQGALKSSRSGETDWISQQDEIRFQGTV